jgi:hypothetical protein
MTEHFEICPMCKKREFSVTSGDRGRESLIECKICGKFYIGNMASFMLNNGLEPRQLNAWIRSQNLRGAEPPDIRRENIKSIIDSLPTFQPSQKPFLLLRSIWLLTRVPGEQIDLDSNVDYPLAWAFDSGEFIFHLSHLQSLGFIELTLYMDGAATTQISHAGLRFLESEPDLDSRLCFVAMSFSESMLPVWTDGLKPGIEDAGFSAMRVDSDQHFGRIDLKIIGDIRASRFVVADATEQKAGVYFEAGFALALGKPVIWSVRKDEIDKVHFDTRQFAHLLWDSPAELRQKIAGMIRGTIGHAGRREH